MLKLLQQVKKGIDNPIKQSNHAEFLYFERLVDEGYIKAARFESYADGLQFFDARLTSKGESCLENKIEPFPVEQAMKTVWTIDRRLNLYMIIISIVGIAFTIYLQSLG